LNVISIKDIDDNGCKLKARDLIFYKIKCHLTKGSKIYKVIEGRFIPDWKKCISSGENKQSLIRFLGEYIVKHINQNSSLQEGQSLYLAGLFSNPETVKMLNQNGMLDCSCLASTQEEADTRIILHALYSDQLYQKNNVQGCICKLKQEI
jgi:hypothetical protein